MPVQNYWGDRLSQVRLFPGKSTEIDIPKTGTVQSAAITVVVDNPDPDGDLWLKLLDKDNIRWGDIATRSFSLAATRTVSVSCHHGTTLFFENSGIQELQLNIRFMDERALEGAALTMGIGRLTRVAEIGAADGELALHGYRIHAIQAWHAANNNAQRLAVLRSDDTERMDFILAPNLASLDFGDAGLLVNAGERLAVVDRPDNGVVFSMHVVLIYSLS